MKTRRRLLLLACLLVALPAIAARARPSPKGVGEGASPVTETKMVGTETEGGRYLKKLDAKLRATLEKEGQVLIGEKAKSTGSYAGYIRAVALFKGDKERVYKLITEPLKQPLYLPRLTGAKSIEAPPQGELIRFTVKVLISSFTFNTRHWYYPEHSRVEWALDPSYKNDIAVQEGYWQLYAVSPQLTVGEYGTRVDTGVAVPDWVQEFLARQDIPEALTAFRNYINSGGTWRRPD